MDDFLDLIKSFNCQISDNLVSYVFYDEKTGKIEKISNRIPQDNTLKFLKVTTDVVEPIVSGLHSLNDYKVSFDIKSQTLFLEKNLDNEINTEKRNINYKLYRIPLNEKEYDLKINQDLQKDQWSFELKNDIRQTLIENQNFINSKLFFSITEPNDPHILYRSITFDIKDLLNNEKIVKQFNSKKESNNNLRIYTAKYFRYTHEVIL